MPSAQVCLIHPKHVFPQKIFQLIWRNWLTSSPRSKKTQISIGYLKKNADDGPATRDVGEILNFIIDFAM